MVLLLWLLLFCVLLFGFCAVCALCAFLYFVRFGWLGGRLFGSGCSLRLQCVFLVHVSDCQFSFFFPTSVFGVGISFLLRLFLIIAYLYLYIGEMC